MSNRILGGFDSFQMEGHLLALANYLGGFERMKNTPLLRQYDYFTRLFQYVFIGLLPLTMWHDFQKHDQSRLKVSVLLLISFVFFIIGKVGEVKVAPFENRITDISMTDLCSTIERDLKEMLGETDLLPKSESENGFLY